MGFISQMERDGCSVVIINGDLNYGSKPELEACAQALADSGKYNIILDLTRTDYVDSAGLGTLFEVYKMVKGKGFLKLVGVNKNVERLLSVTGIATFIPSCSSIDDAIKQ